ncbi:MAG: transcription termination/antitermination protein NusA [Elusimicrobia bacterium]|nr:transcription termination/antitermination protein NusA [Elusimicrobiota bacterium]
MAAKSELIVALEQIEREKGIKKDDILSMIEGAVVSSLRKYVGKNAIIEASIDPETAEFQANVVKRVVDTVTEPELEITLPEAKRYDKKAVVGADVKLPAPAADFARIAAQTAKQLLSQKVREAERDKVYEEFKPKEGEIINGAVHRFVERNVIVDLGKAEAILPLREQIRRERYAVGQNVKALILRVDRAGRDPQVLLSRAAPLFLRRLFEREIPEGADQIIEITGIARDPGFRAKVSVRSKDPKVDAVGSCVGLRGSRIRGIMNEIAGEKIELVPYADDVQAYLRGALAPAKVASVRVLDAEAKTAEVLVQEDQASLAIGKEGQNLRLASRLTGWTLEIKVKQESAAPESPEASAAPDGFSLKKVGPKVIELLVKNGLADAGKLSQIEPEELMKIEGIGEKTAANIIAGAKELLKEQQEPK